MLGLYEGENRDWGWRYQVKREDKWSYFYPEVEPRMFTIGNAHKETKLQDAAYVLPLELL